MKFKAAAECEVTLLLNQENENRSEMCQPLNEGATIDVNIEIVQLQEFNENILSGKLIPIDESAVKYVEQLVYE